MRRIIQKPRTLAERSLPRFVLATLVAGALLVSARATHAAGTPEQVCQNGRYAAAAKYAACHQKAMGRLFGADIPLETDKFEAELSKCRVKYTGTWAKLQAKAQAAPTVETCDDARFVGGGGTVTDNLTGLQWEQKTDDNVTVHDKDNNYDWGVGNANGTVYTRFLATLNAGGCFAGQCDWRLPTIAELQTILLEPFPCTTAPCIDQAVFGPAPTYFYWSATTDATDPALKWVVNLVIGAVGRVNELSGGCGRGVRGGL